MWVECVLECGWSVGGVCAGVWVECGWSMVECGWSVGGVWVEYRWSMVEYWCNVRECGGVCVECGGVCVECGGPADDVMVLQ